MRDFATEKSVIASLMERPEWFAITLELNVSEKDFSHEQNKSIFLIIENLIKKREPVNLATVTLFYRQNQRRDLDLVEWTNSSLADNMLDDAAISESTFKLYLKTLKNFSLRRSLTDLAKRIINESENIEKSEDDLTSLLINETQSFLKVGDQDGIRYKDAISKYLKDLLAQKKKGGFYTGFSKLDEYFQTTPENSLIVLAGRTGKGKTSLAIQIALNIASNNNSSTVLFFSLEMTAQELVQRSVAISTSVASEVLEGKGYYDMPKLLADIEKHKQLPIKIYDSGSQSLASIARKSLAESLTGNVKLIVVDYLQLIKPSDSRVPREQQVAEITRGLKELSKKINCPIIALSQLNRAVETREDKRPTIADLRESGAIEQDSNIILLIHRDQESNASSVIIGKNRSGKTGEVAMIWEGAYARFKEC